MRIRFYSLILLLCSGLVHAAPDADLDAAMQKVVDDYFTVYSKKEGFTAVQASILMPKKDRHVDTKDVKTYVHGTMGLPPNNQPVTEEDLFEIGSITKSFTALLILQLQVEGKLDLDDRLGKWLPQYSKWSKVTIRQLLTMTSGIPNYSADPEFDKKLYADMKAVWTNEQLLEYARPKKFIAEKKSHGFEYSNSNYILAAMIIEKVTKDTYENQLQKRILSNKWLKNTYYPVGPKAKAVKNAIADRMVHGYFYDKSNHKNISTYGDDLSWAGAAGAIVANSQDVVKWVHLLYHGLLIDPQFRDRAVAELESVVSMETGRDIKTVTVKDPHGFGLGVGLLYDAKTKQRFWAYKGSTLGFRVMYLWQPCNDVTTVVALNSKAGEGDPESKIGDAILEANLKLYQAIINLNPQLNCVADVAYRP